MSVATGLGVPGQAFRWFLGGLLALGIALAAPVRADDIVDPLVTKVTELETLIVQHKKEKASQALLVDAKSAAALHKEVGENAELKKRCMGFLDDIADFVKEDNEKKSVLETVGSTGAPEGAKIVKRYLRQPDPEKSDPVLLTAIKVAGVIPVSETAESLLTLFEKSKEMGVAAAALESLGSFGKIKSKRVKILETCVKSVSQVQPGGRGRGSAGQGSLDPDASGGTSGKQGGSSARWGALAPVLPGAMNKLTGQNLGSPQQWFQVVKDTPNLNSLFNQ
jgi:hypothetical protein